MSPAAAFWPSHEFPVHGSRSREGVQTMATSSCIGWLEWPGDDDWHQAFEYAGAGARWRLPPQSCAVYFHAGHQYGHTRFSYKVHGERFDSWFHNRIGASYGRDNRDRAIVPGSLWMHPESYHLGRSYLDGRLRLAPGWAGKAVDSILRGEVYQTT